MKNIRHGDIAFVEIEKLPKGLKSVKTNKIMEGGSGGNSHTFKGGIFYPKVDGSNIIGFFKAKDTKLYHIEHSPEGCKLENGVYEVRRQVEYTHEGMKQVID
jgi:hypothetical protein